KLNTHCYMTSILLPLYLLIDAKRNIQMQFTDILLLQGEENYTYFFCKNRKQHLMSRTLQFFEKDLLNQGSYRRKAFLERLGT
ncbi:MAG: hypothetical protein ACOVOW_11185, partial [Spirosomataceae bacterium]